MRISDWSSDVCSSDLGGTPRDHSAPAAMKGGRIRVLLAEDSATASELLTAILEKEPGIEVVGCAVDGEEAVRSEERRVGKACVSTGRSWWSRSHYKKKKHLRLIV